MNIAAKVAKAKAERPEQFCPHKSCLWRTGGGHCPRHKPIDDDLPWGPPETWAKSYCKRCNLTDRDLGGEPGTCYTMEDNRPTEYDNHSMVEMK